MESLRRSPSYALDIILKLGYTLIGGISKCLQVNHFNYNNRQFRQTQCNEILHTYTNVYTEYI